MSKISVKLKITIWYTALMVLISIISLLAVTSLGNRITKSHTASVTVRAVNNLSMQVLDKSGKLRPLPSFKFFEQGVHMALYDSDHNLINGNIPFEMESKSKFIHESFRTEHHFGKAFYVYDKKISLSNGNSFWIKALVAKSVEASGINSMIIYNIIISFILISAAAIGGYFIISRAFVPVNKISKTAKEITESRDFTRRINIGNGKDEITDLANTFDDMLAKIELSFEKEKQFTSDASHELRTPTAVILSECEYMLDCAKTEEEYKESISSVKRQAEKISKLISELLTISRMDRKSIEPSFEKTDLSELLSFVCDEQEEINKSAITLIRKISPDVEATVDRSLMARLYINLISNAYQYSSDGSSVTVSLTTENDSIVFSVKDEGLGISEENLPKIWERFYRIDDSRTSNDNNSMGLGLSMVKWIAECHKGIIAVKSTVGKGSEFSFILKQ